MSRLLEFYTDGAFSSKTEIGGWAAVCIENGVLIDTQKGYEPYSSNNRMELSAFLSALENADTIETANTKVIIYTDSAYISNCFANKWYLTWMKNGWRTSDKQDVKNQDLWRRIVSLYIKMSKIRELEVIKVKAHAGNEWNEYVNLLAQKTRKEIEEKCK